MSLAIQSTRTGRLEIGSAASTIELQAEDEWIVTGPVDLLAAVRACLPASICDQLATGVLRLVFGNSVGQYRAGPLGTLIVSTGKWGHRDYDRLLERLSDEATALPFSAGASASLPFERAVVAQRDVLYQAFVYLRHVLGPDVAPERALRPALAAIVRDPHRQLRRDTRVVPTHAARTVSSRALLDIVAQRWPIQRAPGSTTPLAVALGGWEPEFVEESIAVNDVDTAPNRFVKAFLDVCLSVIDRVRLVVQAAERSASFVDRVCADCDRLRQELAVARRHSLWQDVGQMTHLPLGSTVLTGCHPYRTVFEHYNRLRLASRWPINDDQIRSMLEVKDIALLYEIWSYFATIRAISEATGAPPVRFERSASDDLQVAVKWDFSATWADGTHLLYNGAFSRSQPHRRRAYSLPLRPDLAVEVPEGRPNSGLHILDAKFKVSWLGEGAGFDLDCADSADTDAEERQGVFKKADLYKMHAYRDAIPHARSSWILYPGTEFVFHPAEGGVTRDALRLDLADGVGAVPLGVDAIGPLANVMQRLLRQDCERS